MNRDSGSSFSLEFSQLESIKEYKEVVNFVPESFDFESVDFDENRSKYRNNPHTIRKLRQKHAKKDKKKEIHGSKKRGSNSSASKAPAKRRVVEVIFKDELPKGKTEHGPFQGKYVSRIAQQDSGSLDCGVFVAIYAEYLREELSISSSGIDAQYHYLKYASLLCKYGSEKAENDYFNENYDPPRPRSKFSPKEIVRVLHIQ
ncbi:hypothetical protein T459_09142 [Capsicum annuum]|uniref:Ubiquitin-like protease family profile domain-containing protein n=1 Tax=Capsicum annuum TaxID=4072 RepID=A0A2G2ZYI6_CAPAN|nr:hypothetical protein T459_09142 [Capsicum annuum]